MKGPDTVTMTAAPTDRRRKTAIRTLLTMLVATAIAAAFMPAISAADPLVFDPDLSLTGSCDVSAVDSVADPGLCPIPPGVPGVDHPLEAFSAPTAVTTDSHGNTYVGSYGKTKAGEVEGSKGRVDIFDSTGLYIETVEVEGPTQIAVDSEGVLYVIQLTTPSGITSLTLSRIKPLVYEPGAGAIEYPDPATPKLIRNHADFLGNNWAAIAINPIDDHLFLKLGRQIFEYGSAGEDPPNPVIGGPIGEGIFHEGLGTSVAIDASRGRLYASDSVFPSGEKVVRVLELSPPHNLVETITGIETPPGKFTQTTIAADEGTGSIFVYDGSGAGSEAVNEFDEEGTYLANFGEGTIKDIGNVPQIRLDNGAESPHRGYLFVPSHPSGVGHVFAYGPAVEFAPEISELSFAEVTRTDAELRAKVNPGNLATEYTFEYIPQQRYEEEGSSFAGAEIAGEGQIPAGKADVAVVAAATGLSPGAAYRFRIVATNEIGTVSEEGSFTTYPAALPSPPCANEALRTGPSALLPDCRAYELVTPPDTNSRTPLGLSLLGAYFPSLQASPAGDRVSFQVQGGAIPGFEGTGSLAGDPYLATRTAAGWRTNAAGPNGAEAQAVLPGSVSPDQGHSIWSTGNPNGSKVVGGQRTNYVRYPDGRSELVGRGSLTTDPRAQMQLISEDASHVLFATGVDSGPAIQLESDAPPAGTKAIYDRTADEVTHVVSLLPGDATPGAGQNALYKGASYDGKGVAFTIGGTLYLRHDNEATYAIGNGVTFAGVAEGGERVFYLEGGDLKAFDVEGGEIAFSTSGSVTPVNVASEGEVAYFVSPSVLSGAPNPNGAEPQPGGDNLYLSREGQTSFVGTVTERDVEGELIAGEQIEGLGLWTEAAVGFPGRDPSRTTPDGNTLLFESRADLDGYDPQGHAQIYRYDFVRGKLDCLSCSPTGAPAAGEASLQSLTWSLTNLEPLSSRNRLANLRADGRRAFFQSEEPLVLEDTDGLQDVYQWEAEGVGSCTRPDGCVQLISSGRSAREDYLFAVSDSGHDVFIRSGDLLAPEFDSDDTPSIFDARVGGGFSPPPPPPGECLGEACQPAAGAPGGATPASASFSGAGNVPAPNARRRCPKGKRATRRSGKVRCVKRGRQAKRGNQQRRRTGAKGRASR